MNQAKAIFFSVGVLWFALAAPANAERFRARSMRSYVSHPSLKKALRRGRCQQALKIAKKLRSSRSIRLLIGRCWSKVREWRKARRLMRPFTQKSYALWDYALVWIGDTYKKEKKIQKAVKQYLKVPKSSLLYREARLRSARMLLEEGQPKRALQSIRKMPSYTRRAAHWWVATQAANALKTKKGKQKAAYWAAKIWVKTPTSHEAAKVNKWIRQRKIQLRLTNAQKIARAFRLNRRFTYRKALKTVKRVRLSRRSSRRMRCRLHFARGFAYFRLRWYRSALPHLKRARRACRGRGRLEIRTLFSIGLSYQRRGRWRKGIPYFRELARRFSRHYLADDAIFRIADSADRSGRKAMAKRTYRELMRRFPRGDMSRKASWRIAYQAFRYGKWKKAKRLLRQIYRRYPRHWYAPAAMYYAAQAQAVLGRRKRNNRARLLRLYRRIVRTYPMHYYSFLALSQIRRYSRKKWRLRRCRWKQTRRGLRCIARKTKARRWLQNLPWGPIPEVPPNSKQMFQLFDGYKAPFLRHPNYLRGRELYRMGLKYAASVEWLRLRSCRVLRPKRKYRRCGRYGDPGAQLLALLFHQAGNYYQANMVFRARGIIAGRVQLTRRTLRTWYLAYPRPFWPIVNRASQRDKVPPPTAYAIMREESAFQAGVLSPSTAHGLMQLMLFTARKEAKSLRWKRPVRSADLFLARHNISLGVHHLRRLADTFKGQLPLIAGAYNAGAHRVRRWLRRYGRYRYDKWVEAIGIKQTRHYVRRVSQSYSIYHLLYVKRKQRYWGHTPFNPNRPPLK